MNHRNQWTRTSLVAAIALTLMTPFALAQPQNHTRDNTVPAPVYATAGGGGNVPKGYFNTPESDGRPGVYYFDLGARAAREHDFAHAIEMYKVAASWACKPVEYNLALMYFKGQGVPVERPLGAAWMVLAAERGDPHYVKARDLMITLLNKVEFAQTDQVWRQLKETYGDRVALRHAKAQWIRVAREATGSHLGHGMGNLLVGVPGSGAATHSKTPVSNGFTSVNGASLVQGGSVDGSVAYQQFQQSENPYDPVFLTNRTGTVTVEPLQPVKPADKKTTKNDRGTDAATQPGPPPRSV